MAPHSLMNINIYMTVVQNNFGVCDIAVPVAQAGARPASSIILCHPFRFFPVPNLSSVDAKILWSFNPKEYAVAVHFDHCHTNILADYDFLADIS